MDTMVLAITPPGTASSLYHKLAYIPQLLRLHGVNYFNCISGINPLNNLNGSTLVKCHYGRDCRNCICWSGGLQEGGTAAKLCRKVPLLSGLTYLLRLIRQTF